MKFYSLTLLSAPLAYSAPYGSFYFGRDKGYKSSPIKAALLSQIGKPTAANMRPRSNPRYVNEEDDEHFNRPFTQPKTSIHPLAGNNIPSRFTPSSVPEPPKNFSPPRVSSRPAAAPPAFTPRSAFKRQSSLINPANYAANVNPSEMNPHANSQVPATGDIDIFKSAFDAIDQALATASLQFTCDAACQNKINLIKREMAMLNTIDFRADPNGQGVQTHHTHIRGNSNKNAGYTYPQLQMQVKSHKNTVGNDYAYYKFSGNSAGNYHIKPENENSEVFLDVVDMNMRKTPQDFEHLFDQSEQMIQEIDETKSFNSVGSKYNLGRPGQDGGNPPSYVLAKIGKATYIEDMPEENYNIGVFVDDKYNYKNDVHGSRH